MGEITDALRRARNEPLAPGALQGRAEPETRVRGAVDAPAPPPAPTDTAPDGRPVAEIPRTMAKTWTARAVLVAERQLVAESFRQFALQLRPLVERRANRAVLV